jgi:hypothetical protein
LKAQQKMQKLTQLEKEAEQQATTAAAAPATGKNHLCT